MGHLSQFTSDLSQYTSDLSQYAFDFGKYTSDFSKYTSKAGIQDDMGDSLSPCSGSVFTKIGSILT